MNSAEEREHAGNSVLCNYLVAFVDLLGQSAKLLELKHAEEIDEESEEYSRWLKGTFGTIKHFREAFFQHVERLNTPRESSPIPEHFIRANVKMIPASDSVVLYVSLHAPDGARLLTNINGLFSVFSALGALAPFFIMMGVPFRAGIAIGLGAEIEGLGFYGSALPLAYELEKKADYPRILIDPYVIEYLDGVSGDEYVTPEERLAQVHARDCRSMIFVDSDGAPALDFLGAKVKSLYAMSDTQRFDVFPKGYEQILASIKGQSDLKIRSKFLLLKEYYDSRAASWLQFGARP